MTAADIIAALDAALVLRGSDGRLIRPGGAAVDVRLSVTPLSANELRPGANGRQGGFRAIISPTPLLAAAWAFPVRTTDLLLWQGVQRVVTFARADEVDGQIVRLELDFVG